MSLMGHDGFGSCSQRSPGAITAGRKWNYARLPVGLLPRGSETVSEGQPPGEFCLWAIAAESRLVFIVLCVEILAFPVLELKERH